MKTSEENHAAIEEGQTIARSTGRRLVSVTTWAETARQRAAEDAERISEGRETWVVEEISNGFVATFATRKVAHGWDSGATHCRCGAEILWFASGDTECPARADEEGFGAQARGIAAIQKLNDLDQPAPIELPAILSTADFDSHRDVCADSWRRLKDPVLATLSVVVCKRCNQWVAPEESPAGFCRLAVHNLPS